MSKHKSFQFSDFSLRDLPCAVAAYVALSLFCIGLGLFLESLPSFWSRLLLGAGSSLLVAFLLLRPFERKVDVAALPGPSAEVRVICDAPACSFADAVKAYRDETGLGLTESTAVLRHYQDGQQHGEQTES